MAWAVVIISRAVSGRSRDAVTSPGENDVDRDLERHTSTKEGNQRQVWKGLGIVMNAQKQVNNRRNFTSANEIPPEYRAAIQAMIEAEMRRRYIDPNAAAFSVEQFCRHYGIGKQTAYEQIKAGHLVAHRPPDCDRTLIRRVDA
ncbi:MAG: hypothetical protein JO204_14395, partial [Alphaproteobacteria bacterium]|nr:hypothetical protein [Alphaproteobacteria bacterium]